MEVQFPAEGRDLRLDLLRGIANWAIFVDHIPNNVVNWLTTRNYGFSDAADLFVYISGYTAALVYARMMIDRSGVSMPLIRSRTFVVLGTAYLVFALVMTMAGCFPTLGQMMPNWLYDAFNPNDKTNLAPYRFVHFVVVAFMVTRFLPRDWRGLKWRVFRPLLLCGQQSLEVFCTGVFLSFAAHFVLVEVSGAIWMQNLVSAVGIVLLTLLAWYGSWSKKIDKAARPANRPGTGDLGGQPRRPTH